MAGGGIGQLHQTLQGHGRGGASALRGSGIDRGAHRGPGGFGATTHAQEEQVSEFLRRNFESSAKIPVRIMGRIGKKTETEKRC